MVAVEIYNLYYSSLGFAVSPKHFKAFSFSSSFNLTLGVGKERKTGPGKKSTEKSLGIW